MLSDLATAVGAFGDLVRAEADDDADDEERRTAAALQALDEARAKVIELRLADADEESIWALNYAVLQAVDRVIAELDVQEQARHRAQGRAAVAERPACFADGRPRRSPPSPDGRGAEPRGANGHQRIRDQLTPRLEVDDQRPVIGQRQRRGTAGHDRPERTPHQDVVELLVGRPTGNVGCSASER